MASDFVDEAEAMIRALAALRREHADRLRDVGRAARNAAIVPLRARGMTLSQIADAFQISRERVRILERRTEVD